jgi:hypothetical protein
MADTKSKSKDIDIIPGDVDVLRLSTKDESEPIEMVTLFEIDDTTYQVPKNPSPTVGLRYLKICKTEGPEAGAYYLLSNMLGEQGYEALMDYEQLTQDQYDFILTAALRIATGKTERPKGRNLQTGPFGRPS